MALWIEHNQTKYTTAEIERGCAAALESLAKDNADPELAYAANLAKAGDEPYEAALADAWDAAETAALNAAEQGWARPGDGTLVWQ